MTELQTWIHQLEQPTHRVSLYADFQVITPMFIGDGQQQADSIRPPAIKGALRFWWRALNWSRCLEQTGSETAALNQLHQEEAVLFGLATKQDSAGNQQGGQGIFSLKVTQSKTLDKVENWPEGANKHCGYIGFGLWETGSSGQRNAIAEGTKFNVEINFKKNTSETLKAQIKQALVFLGLLGGLGSRARRGFGSIALTQLDEQSFVFNSLDDYRKSLVDHLPAECSRLEHLPSFSAWFSGSSIHAFSNANLRRAALGHLDNLYKEIRGDMSLSRRAYFGLPLKNYDSKKRRASPFIMHIHPIGSSFQAITTFMPAKLHADMQTNEETMKSVLGAFIRKAQEKVL